MTITINLDAQLMHEVYLDRLNSGYINASVYPGLEETYRLIRLLILDGGLPRTPKQLETIENRIQRIIELNSGWADYTSDMQEAALYEVRYMLRNTELTPPARNEILSFIGEQMIVMEQSKQAGFWDEFITGNNAGRNQRIMSMVRQGYSRAETVNQVLKNIRAEFDGTLKTRAESLARTAFTHYVQQARRANVSAHPKYYQEAIFVAVWDNRTSLICRTNSKKRFKADDPKLPIPPLHPNCRSTLIYGPEGFELTGQQVAIGGKSGPAAKEAFEKKEARTDGKPKYRGKRDKDAFDPTTVRSDTSHEAWLRRQPRWFVESSLGTTRAKLFLDGKLSLSKFTDMTGRTITLNELEQEESTVFKRLGL